MITEWLTHEQDMKTAETIVAKHTDFNDGKPLAILQMFVVRHKSSKQVVEVKVQDWVVELLDCFREQYGWQQGSSITGKVITRLLLKGETIH
jgi:hypothetical protein